MRIDQHIEAVAREGRRLADAARAAGLGALVPTCPGWDTRELLRHLGLIHLWAASHVAFPHEQPVLENEAAQREFTAGFWPDLGVFWVDDAQLVEWYLATNDNLVTALGSAPADLEAWTFLPAQSARAMWARRQAHETAIHRYDAELAASDPRGYDPVFAADGVDEILCGMTTQRRLDVPVDGEQSMLIHSTDTDHRWRTSLSGDVVTVTRGDGGADCIVSGAASDLYLGLWNRVDESRLVITGDDQALEAWKRTFRVRWYQQD